MPASKTSLAAALCCLLLLSTFISSSESASCCLKYTRNPPPCRALRGYSIQTITGSCDIPAIIFHLRGRFVCANPAKKKSMHLVQCLDERTRKLMWPKKSKEGNSAV